jgi:hypothetical protein
MYSFPRLVYLVLFPALLLRLQFFLSSSLSFLFILIVSFAFILRGYYGLLKTVSIFGGFSISACFIMFASTASPIGGADGLMHLDQFFADPISGPVCRGIFFSYGFVIVFLFGIVFISFFLSLCFSIVFILVNNYHCLLLCFCGILRGFCLSEVTCLCTSFHFLNTFSYKLYYM